MSRSKPESPNSKPDDSKEVGSSTEDCPLGELVVLVKDLDANPIEDATVNAGMWGSKQTNEKGIADFGKVKPGKDTVKAEKEGHATERNGTVGADSKADVEVVKGSKTTVNLVQHPVCANVCFFEGSKTRNNYFGFDHKTNLVQNAGTDEYWLPTPDKATLSLPGSNFTRDGSRWVSVALGKETEVEINYAFKGGDCLPCIKNSTFEVLPSDVAEVVTKNVSAKKANFKIKGKKEGEASLKVICDGHDIGWFHIWCKREVTLKIDVVDVVTNRASLSSYSLGSLKSYFEDVYRQAAIKIDMISLGSVDLKSDSAFTTVESSGYSSDGNFLDKSGSPSPYSNKATVLSNVHSKASAILSARTSAPLPRAGAYRIYRYIVAKRSIAGTVLNIGSSPAFTFMPDSGSARNSICHEFGHCLGLKHPSDSTSTAQFAAHNLSTLNQVVPAYPATNTELASLVGSAKGNVMANDPTNLMGYWSDKANRKPLRYNQWKTCSRS